MTRRSHLFSTVITAAIAASAPCAAVRAQGLATPPAPAFPATDGGSAPLYAAQTAQAPAPYAGPVINRIDVVNNKRVERDTVLTYLGMDVGDTYTVSKANEAIKRLHAIGLFADISVRFYPQKNGLLEVRVDENPSVNKVYFEGNKRVKDDTLLQELAMKPRSVFSKASLQRDTDNILRAYRKTGRYDAKVEPKIIRLDRNRIDLVYEIEEGDKAKIEKIYFTGNNVYSSDELRKVISSSEKRWYRFFSSADTFDGDRMEFDKELLRRHYLKNGYVDFAILSANAEISEDRNRFILTYAVEEGARYRFGDIKIESALRNLDTSALLTEDSPQKGDFFDNTEVSGAVDTLIKELNDRGYAFVDVRPDINSDRAERRADITFRISEGEKVYIDKINIAGNVRTLDNVIRREMRIAEGDPYNAQNIKRSEQRIKNLGYFNNVEIKSKKTGTSDRADLDVTVEERSTGELNFGAGFSTADGALGNISIRERNFLGKGQDVKLSVQRSSRGFDVASGFTEPYFLGRDLSLGFDAYTRSYEYDESSFNSESHGGSIRLSYPLSEYLRHALHYSLEQVNITDLDVNVSEFIRRQEGRNTASAIGHSLTYDKRDNNFLPSEGYYGRVSQEAAGLVGDSQYVKHEFKGRYYHPFFDRKLVFMLGANAGNVFSYGDADVRINERFFIGGNHIRGFEIAGIGPRDRDTFDSLGGNTYYSGTAEMMFPLGLPEELGMRGAIFVDAGSLFDTDDNATAQDGIIDSGTLRAAAGIGLFWTSPLGPIRVDLATPFLKEEEDETEIVRLNFGTRF